MDTLVSIDRQLSTLDMRLSKLGPFQTKNLKVRGNEQCQKLKNIFVYLNHKNIFEYFHIQWVQLIFPVKLGHHIVQP